MFGFHTDLDNVSKRQKIQNEIDDLLTNQQTTVQDIFAIQNQEKQDEIINQLSVANKKVVKFFTSEERINELIDLIIKMPPENCSHERGHKFPFLANQVFTDGGDGVAEIIDRFFYSYKVVENSPVFNKNTVLKDESITNIEVNKLKEKIEELNESPQKLQESGNDEDKQEEDQNSIFQNIRNIVGMLSGGNDKENQEEEDDQFEFQIDDNNNIEYQKDDQVVDEQDDLEERFNFQQIIEKFENQKNVKKSFELRYQNDDDDEIYITNDEDENGDQKDSQDLFFIKPSFQNFTDPNDKIQSRKSSGSPTGGFEKIEFTAKDMLQFDSQTNGKEDAIPNPFKDTLANSDILPKTLKLDVEIHENYMDSQAENSKSLQSFTQVLSKQNQLFKTQSYIDSDKIEISDQAQTSLHQENIMKRKKKKQNLSLYHFDEATQKSIAETVEKERQSMLVDNEKTEKIYPNSMKLPLVSIVEDHIKNGQDDQKQNVQTSEDDDDFGEFNDRELPQQDQIENIQQESKQFTNFEDEEDNILRKPFNKISVEIQENQNQDIVSPTNIFGIEKYDDQNSILIEGQADLQSQELKKEQDYKIIDRFFGFIDVKSIEPLNSTLCGYFCQVCLIMISREPSEMFKYIQTRQFQIFDKMIQHIDNKSICDLLVKILNEVIKYLTNTQENAVIIQEQKQCELQQSGQSGEKNCIRDLAKNEEYIIIIKEIILKILNDKMDENTDIMEKMGALDVLLELLKNQLCYQTLTTKKAFEIMTRFLVSDDEDCQRHVYILLKNLIQNYEKHERFQKRINIDNFEDDELFNSHSGSGSGFLNKSKKSKNSKKQNQDVMKEIQESDLFQYIRVIVKQITSQEIEKKFDSVNAAKKSGIYSKLGLHFLSLIEFLEKASSIFSGFNNDINQTIVEIDVLNFIFVIIEYYSNSDILNRTVLKIVQNIVQTKGEEAQNLIRYMIEDTDLISFLIQNGPKCQVQELKTAKEEPDSYKIKEANDQQLQKSPEQSQSKSKFIQEEITGAKKQEISLIQISQFTAKGLQAHIKPICELMSEHQLRINNQHNLSDIANSKGDLYNQSQSGEQSKSSEIIIETDEEQVNAIRISKIVALNLNENQEWNKYVKAFLEPISKLQKGKLCEDQLKDGHSGSDSENNIFDNEFMNSVDAINANDKVAKNIQNNSDFQLLDIEVAIVKNDQVQNQQEMKKSFQENENFQLDEEAEDHKKFFQKMQKCFSNNIKKNRRNSDCVDNDERDMKMTAYQNHFSELHEDLRASLSDQPSKHFGQRRDRSTSNDNFNLPPLPDLERDVEDFDDSENYKSNNKLSQICVPSDKNYLIENTGEDLELNDIDINLESSQKLSQNIFSAQASYDNSFLRQDQAQNDNQKSLNESEFFNNFEDFAFELMNEEKKYKSNNSEQINIQSSQYGIKSNQCDNDDNQSFQSMEEDQQIFQEKDEIGQIFEQINQFDKLYDIMDDESPEQILNEKNLDQKKIDTSPDFFKDLEIFQLNDNFDENKQEFVGSQDHILELNDDYKSQPLNQDYMNEEEAKEAEIEENRYFLNEKTLFQSQVFNDNNKIEIDLNEKILSKSVCIKNKNIFSLEIKPEFEDNQFWRIGQDQVIDIDQLIQELQ